ncbi:MAG: hypothetical protein ABR865_03650 [Terracidiphilus sp.]|jgi:hypothetical protein
MRVKVNRLLSAGKYHVNFEVGDFTPEELAKMSSFGVPMIGLRWASQAGSSAGSIALNQISKAYDAIFVSEQEAKKYEEGVLAQIRVTMERLRTSKDEFSSSQEVEL